MSELLEKYQAIPPAQKFLLFLITLVGVGAAWYFLMISETEAAIVAERAKTTQLNRQLADLQGLVQNLERFRAEIEQLKKERNEMRDRLPEDAEIASLLQKIHGQGKIVGLEIARFERQGMEPEQLYVRIPVKMTLVGTFHQIATFFYYVGKLTRIVNVENIELAVAERTVDRATLRAVCTATTFMYRPQGAAAGGAQ